MTPTDVLKIARRPLDDDATRRAIANYWAEAGVANYEDTWNARLKLLLTIIEQGETHLARVLAEVARRLERRPEDVLDEDEYVSMDKPLRLPRAGAGSYFRAMVARIVSGLCTPATDAVVELGSGWGEHLAGLWLSSGPRDARYYACELSEAGRKCALVLGALEPSFRVTTAPFNYVAPDFGFLPGQQSAVVYTVQSAEQVREVAGDLFHRLCALAGDVKGVHVEPIGWQMQPREQWSDITVKHAQRCRKKRYNQNLWPLLKQAEADGLIAIDIAAPNFFGFQYNPVSLVVWHKR